ncbi:MAG: hypothetical protein KAW45_05085 [Thermoplasmatales archaeon]|nr:hypothetical protein [Thermoplasmatales archaeon]
MKKILPLLVVIILVLSGLGAVAVSKDENVIMETISFSQPRLEETEDFVSVDLPEATSYTFGYGEPYLPVITKVYTFPICTQVTNVEVTFSAATEQQLSKLVMPAPSPRILSTVYPDDYVELDIETLYDDIDVYPEERDGYRVSAGLDGEEHVIYLTVTVYPFQYVPESNMLYYSDSATIHVTYTPPENPMNFPDEYDFLILAPEEFESALQTLVDHKNGLDPPVNTILVTLDDIPDLPDSDDQEDIKYYIKDAIENWGITYVLLVGAGVKGKELFPVRYAWCSSTGKVYPSDLYFADIYNSTGGFSNWDKDGNGKYAEWPIDIPNVDFCPDVYLGKLPCNNIDEVNTIVDKIINYKAHNKMMKKILQAGGDSYQGDPSGIYEGEYANTVVLTKLPGYSTTQLWGSNGKLTKGNIAKGFNSGVDFVDFSGHGAWNSFATHPPNDNTWIPPKTIISPYDGFFYFDIDIYLFRNGVKLPVYVHKGCSNNNYTKSPNCIGWKMLSKSGGGGIATFAVSGLSYGYPGTDMVKRSTGWMEVKTFEELYNNKILGQVWGNCITDYYNTFEANFIMLDYHTMLKWSMFGDPTLVIEDGDDPINIPVDKPVFPTFLERLINYFPLLARLLELIFVKIN